MSRRRLIHGRLRFANPPYVFMWSCTERQLAALDIDVDGVLRPEAPLQDQLRQRIFDLLLDRPLQRPRASPLSSAYETVEGCCATYGGYGPTPTPPPHPLIENFPMRDIASGTGNSNLNYCTPMQEAQDRLAPATANSPPPAAITPIAQAPGGQQRPVAMPSMQAQLLSQWAEGLSNQARQGGVRGTTSAPLSLAELDRQNQALLAAFRQKADANPNNTPLTKDYLRDVLVELADWLKHQPHHPELRSLSDLMDFVGKEPLDDFTFIRTLEGNFTSSGAAPVRMGMPNQKGTYISSLYLPPDLALIIEALNLSRREPSILLPPAFTSRQDEQLPHTFQLDLLRQGTLAEATVRNIVRGFKHFTTWLHQQTALGTPIPHGLDSLEKLRDHPEEQEVIEVIACFRNHLDTSQPTGNGAHNAVMKFRKLGQQRPAPAASALEAQPRGVRRAALGSQDEARAVRPRLDPARPELPATAALPHGPGLPAPSFTTEELDFLSGLLAQAPEEPRVGAQPQRDPTCHPDR